MLKHSIFQSSRTRCHDLRGLALLETVQMPISKVRRINDSIVHHHGTSSVLLNYENEMMWGIDGRCVVTLGTDIEPSRYHILRCSRLHEYGPTLCWSTLKMVDSASYFIHYDVIDGYTLIDIMSLAML
jgi:hypothetical protein